MARIEILQIVVCLIGSSFNLWGTLDALRQRAIIREAPERRRRHIEANSMRVSRELTRLMIQGILIAAALVAGTIRADVYPDITSRLDAMSLLRMAVSVLSAYTSIRERIGASRLLRLDEPPQMPPGTPGTDRRRDVPPV